MTLEFLTFKLDLDRRELRDRGALVALSPKSFDVLCYLIEHRDRMVTKSEILDVFWSAQVSESALQKSVSLIRKAMRCDGQSVVRTYHGLGFRFVPDVLTQPDAVDSRADRSEIPLQEQRLVSVLCLRFDASNTHDSSIADVFLDQARICVEAHQGEALRMTLDGFTASFGLASRYEDAARRAVHCAVALIGVAAECNDIGTNIGVDHGFLQQIEGVEDVSWHRPSDIERGAVELAGIGQPGDILLSGPTQHQLRDEITCSKMDTGFKLTEIHEMQAGVPGRPLKKPTQFVGRGPEMAFLNQSLDALAAGHGQGVVLSGPAGIGKTRLLGEFLSTLDDRLYRVVKLQCLPGLSNSPLAPIRDMCQALFAQAPKDTLRSDVDAALYADLMGDIASSPPELASISEHQRKLQTHAVVIRMLDAICEDVPLVLVFEDVHWIDATSRDCLDAVVQHVTDKPLLVVATTRPIDDLPLAEAVVQLPPLAHNLGLQLLHDNIGATEMDDQMADVLVRRAGGNPFFIEELALAAQSGGDPTQELPETVQAVISTRIGALDSDARKFLYTIAVIGPPARVDLVTHLMGQDADYVSAMAARLRLMGFILVEPDQYSFRHMLINDTAYAMLTPAERQNMHGVIATYLERDSLDWTPRPETLAWHLQSAGRADKASEYWLKACRSAMQRLAHREAIVFAQNGLVLMAGADIDAAKRELDLQLYLASALGAINGYGADIVGAAYNKARTINKAVANPRANVRILVGLWIHAWVGGRLSQALTYAQDLLDLAKDGPDPSIQLQAHASMGQVLMHTGRLKEAIEHLHKGLDAIADSPPASPPAQIASVACSAFACWTHCMMGNAAETKRILALSKELAHIHENPLAQAVHYGLCGEPFMVTGQIEYCLEYADRAVAVSRAHDFAFWLGTGLCLRGWALGQSGQLNAAFEALDEGIAVFEGTGAGVELSNWYGIKAETLLTAGRLKEGLVAVDHALRCAADTGDVYYTPRIHTVAARLWSETNDMDKAAHHTQIATDLAVKFGMAKDMTTLLI
ncbi:MAG: AAA family ATPase [Paracoccaceae bacterium]